MAMLEVEENLMQSQSTFLLLFIAFCKALLTRSFICFLLNSFDLPSCSSKWVKDKKQGCYVVDVSSGAGGKVLLFSRERLGRGL